jgi:HSP20 family protein
MEAIMRSNELSPRGDRGRAIRPTTTFDLLQQQIDRVFDNFTNWGGLPVGGFSPSMEVAETPEALEITTELPGIDEKDLEINVADGVLTIRGEKKEEKKEEQKTYRLIERSYGSFERALALPRTVDVNAVKANMSNGVLKITIPKTPESQAQRIRINKD